MIYYQYCEYSMDGLLLYIEKENEAILDGEDYVIPDNATFVAPPDCSEDEIQVWDEELESWSIINKSELPQLPEE